MIRSRYETLKIRTKNIVLIWKNVHGVADEKVADKMDKAMLNWIIELTDCLSIWIDKGESLTEGKLILARVNMGALVESWLKLFYCIFYNDYLKAPEVNKKGNIIEPNDMSYEKLKTFSIGKLWDSVDDPEYSWVGKIQHMRNAIHAFNYKDIGTPKEFIEDLEKYYDFVENICDTLPPIEDFIEKYPEGYEMNIYFE